MAVEKKEIEFVKELDDAMVLVVELVKDIKAGKPVTDIVAENLPLLMTALSSADQIPEELMHGKVAAETVGYRLGDLIAALTGIG